MQICGAGPYDQHLMLGEHELTDHSQSLAALGIFPGALLTLKVGTLPLANVSRNSPKNLHTREFPTLPEHVARGKKWGNSRWKRALGAAIGRGAGLPLPLFGAGFLYP